jgi:hypothetical protein
MTESEVQKNEGERIIQLHEPGGCSFWLWGGHVSDVLARIEEPQRLERINLEGKALQHDFVSMPANICPRASLAYL